VSAAEERVFPASRTRRQSLRRRGDVAAASWFQVALPVVASIWMMDHFGGQWFDQFQQVLDQELRNGLQVTWQAQQAWDQLVRVAVTLAGMAWPLVVVPWATCLGARFFQTRFLFAWGALRPDPERLSVFSGFRRMGTAIFGRSMGRTILQSLVAGGICGAVVWAMSGDVHNPGSWTALEGAIQGLLDSGLRPMRTLCFSLMLVGLADLVWQGVAYERRIRMTAEEVREELRNSERKSNGARSSGQMTVEVEMSPSR